MKKLFHWISDNILFLITLFLLVFIPLYPKKPLVDIVNTWVYVRLEDFVIVSVMLVWLALLVRKKITLKTPLTMPILIFWIVGAIATIHGVLLIFPGLPNVFPNVALLSFFRRIEYLSLYFIAFSSIKDKKQLPMILSVLAITFFAVALYGFGQRYAGFPAYLTMNEEFAKGEAIHLSALSRVPSTFAGHYDLAAYLVLMIPLLISLIFGVRNWFIKLFLLVDVVAGFGLLFMTVSRVSFFVLFVAIAVVFFFHKKKWVMVSLPVVAIAFVVLLLTFAPRLIDRFTNTVKEINVLVDAQTGEALGNIKDIDHSYFVDKTVRQRFFQNSGDIDAEVKGIATEESKATASGIIPFKRLPETGVLLVPPNASTGENLPQGTGYINLPLSQVREHRDEFFYVNRLPDGQPTSEVQMFSGKFLVKKALAYDLSLTTRYQGEWPHALEAFQRNIFLGSGYGSISLAIDNSYLRMLGETGFLGFLSFFVIFVAIGAYIKHSLAKVESPLTRSFVVGFTAGVFGLILNATLIDVFEASKIAFYLWMLTGILIGVLHFYQTKPFVLYKDLKIIATSSYAIMLYLAVITFFIYAPMLGNYFVGDDFTWLRWVATHGNGWDKIIGYFTQSDGFFYRPGTKMLFLGLYSVFWLNPLIYHMVSLVAHFLVVLLVFILAKKILRNFHMGVIAAFLFVVLSSYHETVFWIASIGHIISSLFVLLSIWMFMFWSEKKKIIYFLLSLFSIAVSLMFHELGVVAPLLIMLYKVADDGLSFAHLKLKKIAYAFLFSPVILYLIVRYFSHSHWFNGDYNYSLVKLPFNIIGNFIGYLMLSVFGPFSLPVYEALRNLTKTHLLLASIFVLFTIGIGIFVYRLFKKLNKEDRRIIVFGVGFMFLALLPFLGLGNITSRYSYLVSFGFVVVFAFFAQKTYSFLLSNGRDIAISVMTLILGAFFLLHIIQVQQIHGDWHDAGLKVNNFFIAIEGQYLNYWSHEHVELNFVNVPIRNGEAWVFPVGLEDAVWFAFKSPHITVRQWQSLDQAFAHVSDPIFQKVYLFDDSGKVIKQEKPKPE